MIDVLVVTGAGQGIGKAVALELGIKNVPVLCISKSLNAQRTKQEIIKSKGIAESLILDIGDYNNTEKLVAKWISGKPYKKIGVVLAAAILESTVPASFTSLKFPVSTSISMARDRCFLCAITAAVIPPAAWI